MLSSRYPTQPRVHYHNNSNRFRPLGAIGPNTAQWPKRCAPDICYAVGSDSRGAREEEGIAGHGQPNQPSNRNNSASSSSSSSSSSRGRVGPIEPTVIRGSSKGMPQDSRVGPRGPMGSLQSSPRQGIRGPRPKGLSRGSKLNGDIKACVDIHALAQLVQQHEDALNHVSAAAAIRMAANLQHTGRHAAQQLVEEVLSEVAAKYLGQMDGWGLANTLWALAELELRPCNGLVAMLVERCRPRLYDFNYAALVKTEQAMGTLGVVDDDGLVEKLLREAQQGLDQAPAHGQIGILGGRPPKEAAGSRGMSRCARLNGDITACGDIQALVKLVQEHVDAFDCANVATAINMAAKLQLSGQSAARQLVEEVLSVAAAQRLGKMDARELANTLRALAKLGLQPRNGLVALLLERCKPRLLEFRPEALTGMVRAVEILGVEDDGFVELLLREAKPRLDLVNARGQAEVMVDSAEFTDAAGWGGLSRCVRLNEEIKVCGDIHALAELVEEHVGEFDSVNVSTAVNMAAKLQPSGRRAAQQLVEEVLSVVAAQRLGQMAVRELANTLRALAKLGLQPSNGLVALLLERCRPRLHEFEPQELANTMWAMATLGVEDDAFTGSLLREAQPRLDQLTAQALANTVWALATLNVHDDAFLSSLCQAAQSRLGEFNAWGLAETAWAMATLRRSDPGFMEALAAAAKPMVCEFNARNLTRTLEALAKLKHHDDGLVAQLVEGCKARLDDFSPRELSLSAWALSKLRWRDEQLMQMIQRRVVGRDAFISAKRRDRSSAATAVAIAIAIARLSCPVDATLGQELAATRRGFNDQKVCNLAWAHAVSGEPHQAWLQGLVLDHVWPLGEVEQLHPKAQCQLFQYFLELQDRGVLSLPPPEEASVQLLMLRCKQSWLEQVGLRAAQAISDFQSDVLQHCKQQPGWQVLGGEHLTEDGLFSIDVALQLVSQDGSDRPPINVAVEADGPSHFTRNEPHTVLGVTAARTRSLQRRGWLVLSIPFYEWLPLRSGAKSAYLGARLQQLLGS